MQKRRFSTAHGSDDTDGGGGSTLPMISIGSPVVAVAVRLALLGGQEHLAAGGRRAQAVQLARTHRRGSLAMRPAAFTSSIGTLARVRVLIFHGYLLRGTGSNVYNAALGRGVRARAGTRSTCSARTARRSSCRGSTPRATGTAARCELRVRRDPPRATVYRPDIGGLLPVYVADRYDGVEARPYPS